MNLTVTESEAEFGRLAADHILARLASHPVLGVATGSTPLPLYAALAARRDELPSEDLQLFALDEYLGLPSDDPASYREFLLQQVIRPCGLDPDQLHLPPVTATVDEALADPEQFAAYDRQIAAAGGVGVQILGLGSNGHIGFNEPGSALDSRTRLIELSESTRRDNSRFFPDNEVPRFAVTQGIATIMGAADILLLVTGEKKAEALCRAFTGPVTEQLPASVLQRHPSVQVIADRAAAKRLLSERAIA